MLNSSETPFSLADNSNNIPMSTALRNALTLPAEPLEVLNDHQRHQTDNSPTRGEPCYNCLSSALEAWVFSWHYT